LFELGIFINTESKSIFAKAISYCNLKDVIESHMVVIIMAVFIPEGSIRENIKFLQNVESQNVLQVCISTLLRWSSTTSLPLKLTVYLMR